MPASKAQLEAKARYDKKTYDNVLVKFRKDSDLTLAMVKEYASAHSESVNGFIRRTIVETMERVLCQSPINVLENKLETNLNRLKDIARLREDWNGYGATPISHFVISEAICIIFALNAQPDAIFPTGRKSIQLEYHSLNKNYLEFEIFDEKIVAMQVFGTDYDNARFWEFSHGDTDCIRKIVEDFVNAK